MSGALQHAWLRRGPLACLLWPVSLLYGVVAAVHRQLYARGARRIERLPVAVIVVGNVVAGGAGKTPVVIELVQHLRHRGLKVGVVSRGYGRTDTGCREVRREDDAALSGDEPLLIRRRTDAPVFVARRRAEAGRALLAAYPQTEVIVSDDGLQHHALARDIEICVFDTRGVGNAWLLPAGPLREPWPRPVDLVLRAARAPVAGHELRRSLGDTAGRADGTRMPLAGLRGRPVHAVAAIAQPESFFAMLREVGIDVAQATALPDHAGFEGFTAGAATLVCTEKDAAKLWRTQPGAWAVPLEVEIDAAFWRTLDRLLDAKLSSAHGSPPA